MISPSNREEMARGVEAAAAEISGRVQILVHALRFDVEDTKEAAKLLWESLLASCNLVGGITERFQREGRGFKQV